MTGPEVESEASSGFSSRRFALNRYEKLIEPSRAIVVGELEARHWDVAGAEDRAADDVAGTELAADPWWLWWNVFSLDAPTVAVAWALVFAKSAGVVLPAAEVGVLGLVVWLIYTVDRLLDGRSSGHGAAAADGLGPAYAVGSDAGAFGSPLRRRHIFHRIHARAIACVAAGVAAFTAILVLTQIVGQILKLAVPLGIILVLYMAWVHLGRGRALTRLPKEVAVGGIFAAGVVLPAWSRLGARRWELFLLAVLFAAVCTLNCVAIEEWERVRGQWAGTIDRGSGRFAIGLAVCAALLAPVVRLRGEFSAIGAAIAVGALLILFLDLMREQISAEGLRVLVDLALLLPALVVLAIY